MTEENVRRSRRAYFANISYLDEKVGELIDTLTRTRMLDDTLILFCSDHGDMLGERGLWFKMNFFEGSARVPLMIAGPGIAPGLHLTPTSNLDVTPTLADLAGISLEEVRPWTDGVSLVPMVNGVERTEPVLMEYAAEASYAPLVAIREGKWKYVYCALDPEQLFDLEADPLELTNLAENRAGPSTGDAHGIPRHARGALGHGSLRRCRAREPGTALGGLRSASQRRLLPLGPPAAAKGIGALHAQPHEPRHSRGIQTLSARRMR